jgi:hypothetical protein
MRAAQMRLPVTHAKRHRARAGKRDALSQPSSPLPAGLKVTVQGSQHKTLTTISTAGQPFAALSANSVEATASRFLCTHAPSESLIRYT